MRLITTRKTLLTGDVKTVAALNVIQIALFQRMDRWYSDMLVLTYPRGAPRQATRVGAGADIGQHGQRWPSWLQEKARRRWSLDTYQLHRLHYENEALKGKNASTRILTDTAIINEMNTRARGGNPADIPHHDIGFSLPQSHSLSISPSLICSPFACPLSYSALHPSVCNTFCRSINIVPGVDLITSVGPNLFSCQ